jgi:hypothetical protein
VVCDQPPGLCYEAQGECIQGQCSYLPDNGKSCDDGDSCTEEDVCLNGLCSGQAMACDDPPPATCLDGQILVTYGSSGSCQAGECVYPETSLDCEHGCTDGACQSSGDPVVLSDSHPGWTGTDCFTSGCHIQAELLPNHESGLRVPQCAACHGANGACYPCGRTTSCASCHGYRHGYSATSDCKACHYDADDGIRYCW